VPNDSSSLLRRLALYYFFTFGALGWFFPQLPIFVERAVGVAWVGAVMVAFPLFGLLTAPLWGYTADRYRASARLLVGTTAAMAPVVLLYSGARSFSTLLLITTLFALLRAPQVPLADALAHRQLEGEHHRFARCRIWGSVGFVLFAAVSGSLGGVDAGAAYLVTPALCYLLAAGAMVGVVEPVGLSPRMSVGREVLALMRRPTMWRALAGVLVYYSGHSLFDAYFGLHVAALGLPAGHASLGWSFGALVEIGMMIVAPTLLARVEGRRMLTPVSLLAALRWALTSVVRNPLLLIAVQGLHGFSFGLWYLSIIHHLQASTSPSLRASVQGVTVAVWGAAQVMGYGLGGLLLRQWPTTTLYHSAALISLVAAGLFLLVPAARKETHQ